jgi:carbonic anhydrase
MSTPITWRQIDTFWDGNVDKNNMDSNYARKVMRNGHLVSAKFKRSTNEAKQKTFDLVMKHFCAEWSDNAIPILK